MRDGVLDDHHHKENLINALFYDIFVWFSNKEEEGKEMGGIVVRQHV